MENLAQSTNELEFVNAGFTMDQKLYIDFGKMMVPMEILQEKIRMEIFGIMQ